jgi:hypothetical protein
MMNEERQPDGLLQIKQERHLVEFFGFQFLELILGLGITALIFWSFCIKTKGQ